MRHRRMAVYDEFAVVLRRVEKFMTNPEQIVEVLLLDRDSRADTRMHEQEIATTKTVAEALQENLVRAREARSGRWPWSPHGSPAWGSTIEPNRAISRIDYDLDYIEKWSLRMDFMIIARTIRREFLSGNGF
jgi:hypothetical protein